MCFATSNLANDGDAEDDVADDVDVGNDDADLAEAARLSPRMGNQSQSK
jgi:hypothetical protein